MRLAQSITEDRQRLGMSQQQLADHLGVTQQSVAKWEAGKAEPRRKLRDSLIGVLGKKSQTATLLRETLRHVGAEKGGSMYTQPTTTYEQALAQIAKAAEELARAAQAIAVSVEKLSSQKPPDQQRH